MLRAIRQNLAETLSRLIWLGMQRVSFIRLLNLLVWNISQVCSQPRNVQETMINFVDMMIDGIIVGFRATRASIMVILSWAVMPYIFYGYIYQSKVGLLSAGLYITSRSIHMKLSSWHLRGRFWVPRKKRSNSVLTKWEKMITLYNCTGAPYTNNWSKKLLDAWTPQFNSNHQKYTNKCERVRGCELLVRGSREGIIFNLQIFCGPVSRQRFLRLWIHLVQ